MIVNGTELVERLIACGFSREKAEEVCRRHFSGGNYSELEALVRRAELFYDDRKEYA